MAGFKASLKTRDFSLPAARCQIRRPFAAVENEQEI